MRLQSIAPPATQFAQAAAAGSRSSPVGLINQPCCPLRRRASALFGYDKGEMEGKNISAMMCVRRARWRAPCFAARFPGRRRTRCVATLTECTRSGTRTHAPRPRRPQPFSSRHNGYLARYVGGGEPHILNSRRAVVGLTKQRSLVPLALVVVRLSGDGEDSVFLGVLRRAEAMHPSTVRVSVAGWHVGQGAWQAGCGRTGRMQPPSRSGLGPAAG